MSKFSAHEIKEENYLFLDLNERGRVYLTLRLTEDHRKLNQMPEEFRKSLDEYQIHEDPGA